LLLKVTPRPRRIYAGRAENDIGKTLSRIAINPLQQIFYLERCCTVAFERVATLARPETSNDRFTCH
jgi:hypothetical protein